MGGNAYKKRERRRCFVLAWKAVEGRVCACDKKNTREEALNKRKENVGGLLACGKEGVCVIENERKTLHERKENVGGLLACVEKKRVGVLGGGRGRQKVVWA